MSSKRQPHPEFGADVTWSVWDERFLALAKLVSGWSKDPSTKCGAVLVRPDNTIISVGYNGFPRRMPDFPSYLNNRREKYARIIHAEMNAFMQASGPIAGARLFVWPFLCCHRCFVHLANAGITSVTAPIDTDPARARRWAADFRRVRRYANEMNITIKEIPA